MDKETLALLQDGLRHIKVVGVLGRWMELQKGRAPQSSKGAGGKK